MQAQRRCGKSYQGACVEAFNIGPIQDHQRQQVPNVHGRRCRINADIYADSFLRHQSIKVISIAGGTLSPQDALLCLSHLPDNLIYVSSLLQHSQHALLPASLDLRSPLCPLYLRLYCLLEIGLGDPSLLMHDACRAKPTCT